MDLLRRGFLTLSLLAALGAATPLSAEPASIVVASTTSTEQSGLFKHILPLFKQKTGIEVKVVALGTGQALDAARRGDADVVLVHDRPAEDKFVAEGYAKARQDVMYNDFVLIGPKDDPAGIRGKGVEEAFRKIAAAKAPFVSRGDRSGTHSAELRSWKEAGIDLGAVRGDWYRDVGQGMGPALNTASSLGAYILADRGTWLSFKNRGDLTILVEGDPRLFNPYGVMLVNPDKHPTVKVKEGQAFIDWLVSSEGQKAIEGYTINGEQLFFPSAKKS
ncbi:extracellular solute-binding protein family 1 [Methylorubrum populi BJ001]|uniref:Extracellular solute-binding protein family 1 n=1 Tax=Methylorubrum populi (strain ATCC BAA-705 / NCIMB 13946 / BJ001) TaxID=441620 RepID=B1ZFH2_METPB|nr:extracellular solute-binding protein [Methylorubrum populi]ACB81125.1 extracellular solute-binding protein family 1 [Methylorubrum populi BJ001]OAH33745.1 tungsten ABC transporter substrate-binding protein [Methylorubrum populi]PZP73249.1 MAG: tungsten ABC transporter substrate-binding protein [Methylorubrum populi]